MKRQRSTEEGDGDNIPYAGTTRDKPDEDILSLSPSALAASRFIHSGASLTSIYAKLDRVTKELEDKKMENLTLKAQIGEIISELRDKAPRIRECWEDNERLLGSNEEMSKQCDALKQELKLYEQCEIIAEPKQQNTNPGQKLMKYQVPPSKKGAAVITPPAVPTKPVKPGSLQKVTPSSNNNTNQSVVSSYSTSTSSTIHHKEDPSGQPHHLGTSSGGGGGPNANFRKELEKKINHWMSHTPSSVGGGGGGISGSSPTPPSAASNNTANTTTIPINTPASQQYSASPTPAATQLSHSTASRPKQSKRPPSKLFLSERSQESSKTDAIYMETEESMQQGEPPVSSSNPVSSSYPKTNIHATLANKGSDVVKGSTTAVSSSNTILPPSILLSSSTRGGDTPSISSPTGSASASAVTNNIHNIHHHSSSSGGMVSMEAFQSLKSKLWDANRKIKELETRLKKLEK